jgi:hypothetical protein
LRPVRTAIRSLALATIAFPLAAALTPAAAQIANALPAAMGMGDNYTAVARGYAAVAWNPAGLGMSGGPQASASIGALRVLGGMGPVTLSDLRDWQGELVPLDVRERWLADIRSAGGQTGAAGFDFNLAAFQTRPLRRPALDIGQDHDRRCARRRRDDPHRQRRRRRQPRQRGPRGRAHRRERLLHRRAELRNALPRA